MKNSVRALPSGLVVLVGLVMLGLYPLLLPAVGLNSLNSYSVYFVWVTLAVSWNLAGGYAKLLNLGLVAFFALGSVVGAVALTSGLSYGESIALSGLAGSLVAFAMIPTFRFRTFYFAIATLFVPLVIKPLVELVAGVADFRVPQEAILGPVALYYLGISMSGLTILGSYLLIRSRVGYALKALGEDELVSSSVGIDVLSFKAIALIVSGIVASVAGSYYLQIIGTVNTTLFTDLNFSLFPIFMVIIGGAGTVEGPIGGALIFSVLNYEVTSFLPNSTLDTLVLSAMIIGVAVFLPKGIVPAVRANVSRGGRFRLGRPSQKKGGE
ncbi:MAG: branched-chain amino acid ABC transporter permease [Nitrososphaerales archaeon]|nr:branched-chain amino acid ABC transporter permease [Nitrososphaerales archaeon]